jgi:hypothetical protein
MSVIVTTVLMQTDEHPHVNSKYLWIPRVQPWKQMHSPEGSVLEDPASKYQMGYNLCVKMYQQHLVKV